MFYNNLIGQVQLGNINALYVKCLDTDLIELEQKLNNSGIIIIKKEPKTWTVQFEKLTCVLYFVHPKYGSHKKEVDLYSDLSIIDWSIGRYLFSNNKFSEVIYNQLLELI